MWVHVEVISSLGGWAILSNNEQQYVYSDRKTIGKQKKIIHFYVFNDVSHYELLVCYIQMFYIILKLNFLWVSALELDQTFVLNQSISFPKCWKNDEILEFRRNFLSKTPGSGNLHLRSSPWRKFWERIINEVICSTSSRRKPGWRFTAGSTFSESNTETVAEAPPTHTSPGQWLVKLTPVTIKSKS